MIKFARDTFRKDFKKMHVTKMFLCPFFTKSSNKKLKKIKLLISEMGKDIILVIAARKLSCSKITCLPERILD